MLPHNVSLCQFCTLFNFALPTYNTLEYGILLTPPFLQSPFCIKICAFPQSKKKLSDPYNF